MGTDLCGWIECKDPYSERTQWDAVINLYYLTQGRDYDALACLFGVKNYVRFRPVAAHRSIPSDASAEVRAELARQCEPVDALAPSWVTWDEPAEQPDQRVHMYTWTPDGHLEYETKAAGVRELSEAKITQTREW